MNEAFSTGLLLPSVSISFTAIQTLKNGARIPRLQGSPRYPRIINIVTPPAAISTWAAMLCNPAWIFHFGFLYYA